MKGRAWSAASVVFWGTDGRRWEYCMKKLPESELELMMIIWQAGRAMTRPEIEAGLGEGRKLGATTILSFLSRLQEKGFLKVERRGKSNVYEPLIKEQEYLKQESGEIFKRLYRGSIRSFVASLYEGDNLSDKDLAELQAVLDEKKGKAGKKR